MHEIDDERGRVSNQTDLQMKYKFNSPLTPRVNYFFHLCKWLFQPLSEAIQITISRNNKALPLIALYSLDLLLSPKAAKREERRSFKGKRVAFHGAFAASALQERWCLNFSLHRQSGAHLRLLIANIHTTRAKKHITSSSIRAENWKASFCNKESHDRLFDGNLCQWQFTVLDAK